MVSEKATLRHLSSLDPRGPEGGAGWFLGESVPNSGQDTCQSHVSGESPWVGALGSSGQCRALGSGRLRCSLWPLRHSNPATSPRLPTACLLVALSSSSLSRKPLTLPAPSVYPWRPDICSFRMALRVPLPLHLSRSGSAVIPITFMPRLQTRSPIQPRPSSLAATFWFGACSFCRLSWERPTPGPLLRLSLFLEASFLPLRMQTPLLFRLNSWSPPSRKFCLTLSVHSGVFLL